MHISFNSITNTGKRLVVNGKQEELDTIRNLLAKNPNISTDTFYRPADKLILCSGDKASKLKEIRASEKREKAFGSTASFLTGRTKGIGNYYEKIMTQTNEALVKLMNGSRLMDAKKIIKKLQEGTFDFEKLSKTNLFSLKFKK